MHYTYVLEGYVEKTKKYEFYTGYTKDLKNRIKQHLSGEVKSTKKYSTLKLVYYEASLHKDDARQRELQLKTGFGRGYLKRRLHNYQNTRV